MTSRRSQSAFLLTCALALGGVPCASATPAPQGVESAHRDAGAGSHPSPSTGSGGHTHSAQQPIPHIEEWAPGAFDPGERRLRADRAVRYRVNATVLLPLLVTSIPLVSRDDVGVGSFAMREFDDENGPLRTYEFFAASIPDRARGLNRLGFIREAVKLGDDGASWTAQFGVISADRAETREAAERSLEQDQSLQPYTLIDAMIRSRSSSSSVATLLLEGKWESAAALFADVRGAWRTAALEPREALRNPSGNLYEEPLGFLGAIQRSLRHVALEVAGGSEAARFRTPYVHDSRVLQLEFREQDIDRGRAADYAATGLVPAGTVVHRLEYRVYDEHGDDVESFKIWTELPANPESDRRSPAIVPVSFELQPRSYLRLTAVQIPR